MATLEEPMTVLGAQVMVQTVACDICQVTPADSWSVVMSHNPSINEDLAWCEICNWMVEKYGVDNVWTTLLRAPNRRAFITTALEEKYGTKSTEG
jgi:hypothetical protein